MRKVWCDEKLNLSSENQHKYMYWKDRPYTCLFEVVSTIFVKMVYWTVLWNYHFPVRCCLFSKSKALNNARILWFSSGSIIFFSGKEFLSVHNFEISFIWLLNHFDNDSWYPQHFLLGVTFLNDCLISNILEDLFSRRKFFN